MTIKEYVKNLVKNWPDMGDENEPASVEKMLLVAYYMGREQATREISDRYNAHIAEQKKRASECRYHDMAAAVVGKEDFLYSPDYSMEVTSLFGGDKAIENT